MNIMDRFISFVSPRWGLARLEARATLQQIEGIANGKSGYDAGKLNRLTKGRLGTEAKEHAIPLEQIERVRWQSWNLWRNNPYARKIVRNLESKVVGKGMFPVSHAVNPDGSPNVEFRAQAKKLWMAIQNNFDSRGLPGRGGVTMGGLQRLALRAVILSGETLDRLIPITQDEQQQRDLPIPLTLQMIDAARLADAHHPATGTIAEGNILYRGIEINPDTGKRIAYWVNQYLPGYVTATYGTSQRLPAEQVCHLYVEDDIDQLRGVPWFAAALLQARDTGDLQYNVLKASAMAACVVMGYRKPTGAAKFGLNAASETNPTSADGTDLTDEDGNAITKIQPGMFVNLGRDGALEGFSPNQPNTNAEAFIQHMLRGISAAFPGVKASTVHGDYRNSSFSSEKAADNDTWPEIESVQEWFGASFCQPIYEAVIRAGVLSGYFDGVVSADEFGANPASFLAASWQGPTVKSINPMVDVNAAGLRMKFGLSSLQMECAALNVNWIDVLNNIAEIYEVAVQKGIPEEVVNNILGVTAQQVIASQTEPAKTDNPDANDSEDQTDQTDDSEEADDNADDDKPDSKSKEKESVDA